MRVQSCAHCGLPVLTPVRSGKDRVFCCYGCLLVSRLAGGGDGQSVHAWNLMRLGVGAFLAMDVMMVSLLLYTGTVEPQAVGGFRWLMLGLSAPAMILLVWPFVRGAAGEISRRRMSLDTLVAVGSLAAFSVSAVSTIIGSGQVYFDTATMLLTLVTFGKLIEATAKRRAGDLLRHLQTLLPAKAMRLEKDGPCEVAIGELRPGDRLQVRPGERFPADGVIRQGSTIIEEAAFTGEWRPRPCAPGDDVFAGTVNTSDPVVMEATQTGEGLLLRRIIELAEQARLRPSTAERLSQRVATLFTPAVLVLAAGSGAAWLVWGSPGEALLACLAVLVVACPCAMGIATGLATALAVARAARQGALVRGGDVLESLGRVRTLFFDKTGTVTSGQATLVAMESIDPSVTRQDLLSCLATLEAASEHALGRAIVSAARSEGLAIGTVAGLQNLPGLGLRGSVQCNGRTLEVTAGSELLMKPPAQASGILAEDGASVVYVGWEGRLRGKAVLNDTVRSGAANAVADLHARGIRTVLLSGDRHKAALAVARQVGIDNVEAPRGPDHKLQAIQAASRDDTVAMVGDGINDAPALAAADVGIALGAGTDLARQAGNVVLLSDDLAQIPWLIDLSRQARRIIKQNLLWALGYNALALAAAAAGMLHPLLAALAMVVSSLTVLCNSLRLQAYRGPFRPAHKAPQNPTLPQVL